MLEGIEDLRANLDSAAIVDLSVAQRLAHRFPVHVLVGDVDVPVVGCEVENAQAAPVPEPGGRLHFSLRTRSRLALSGNDLQRKLMAGSLVPSQPDRARASAS